MRRVCYRDLHREDHLFLPALSLCWTFLLDSATLFASAKKARVLLLMLRCSHFALFPFPSRAFDRNSNGTIDFHEFQGLHAFLINMQNSFTHFDMDRSGKLTVEEVQRAVEHAGIATTLSISQELQCLSSDFKWLVSWSVKISEDKKIYDGLSIMQGLWILPAVFCKDIWRKPFTISTFLTTLLIDVSVSDIDILQQDTLGFDVFEFFCHATLRSLATCVWNLSCNSQHSARPHMYSIPSQVYAPLGSPRNKLHVDYTRVAVCFVGWSCFCDSFAETLGSSNSQLWQEKENWLNCHPMAALSTLLGISHSFDCCCLVDLVFVA